MVLPCGRYIRRASTSEVIVEAVPISLQWLYVPASRSARTWPGSCAGLQVVSVRQVSVPTPGAGRPCRTTRPRSSRCSMMTGTSALAAADQLGRTPSQLLINDDRIKRVGRGDSFDVHRHEVFGSMADGPPGSRRARSSGTRGAPPRHEDAGSPELAIVERMLQLTSGPGRRCRRSGLQGPRHARPGWRRRMKPVRSLGREPVRRAAPVPRSRPCPGPFDDGEAPGDLSLEMLRGPQTVDRASLGRCHARHSPGPYSSESAGAALPCTGADRLRPPEAKPARRQRSAAAGRGLDGALAIGREPCAWRQRRRPA